MKMYKIVANVPEDKFQALIRYYEAIGVTNFSVNMQVALSPPSAPAAPAKPPNDPASTPAAREPRKVHRFHYVGGKKNKGISAKDLTLQILNTSPNPIVSCQELRSEFVKHGFAKTSISSPLSELRQERKIVNCGEGRWALKTRHVGPMQGSDTLV